MANWTFNGCGKSGLIGYRAKMAGTKFKICFGGTFNPMYFGHLISARAVGEALGADIVLIPCNQPPHKSDSAELASAQDRLEMCRIAVAGLERFEVDDCEIR